MASVRRCWKFSLKKNFEVIGTYLSNQNKAEKLEKKYPNALECFQLDLSWVDSIINFAEEVKKQYKTVDILINNAGYVVDELLSDSSLVEIDKQIVINLIGTIEITKLLVDFIDTRIINIESQYAKEGHKYYVAYCASKWGIRGFTKSLADEYRNLQVLTINPGLTKTKMNDFWEQAIEPNVFAKVFYDEVFKENNYKFGNDVDLYKIMLNN